MHVSGKDNLVFCKFCGVAQSCKLDHISYLPLSYCYMWHSFTCLWYNFFMGHLHQNELLCKVFIIVVFYEQLYIAMWCEKFMWKIQLGLICITHIHFFLRFLWVYIKNTIFYKFILLVKVTQDRNAFLMWSVMWFLILFLQSWNCAW